MYTKDNYERKTMNKLFEIKMHDAIFDIEYAKINMADRLYAYQIYCSVGNSGDLIAGDFKTINEAIDWITNSEQAKAAAKSYASDEEILMEAYGETSIQTADWFKEIPNGTMLLDIIKEKLTADTYK